MSRKYKEATIPGNNKQSTTAPRPYLNYMRPKDTSTKYLNSSNPTHYANAALLGTLSNFDQIKSTLIKQAKEVNVVKQPSMGRSGGRSGGRPDSSLKVRLFNQANPMNPKIIDSKHVKNLKYKVHNDSLSTASSLFPSIRNTESLNNKFEDGKMINYNLDHLINNHSQTSSNQSRPLTQSDEMHNYKDYNLNHNHNHADDYQFNNDLNTRDDTDHMEQFEKD